jgi:hypothetical protein
MIPTFGQYMTGLWTSAKEYHHWCQDERVCSALDYLPLQGEKDLTSCSFASRQRITRLPNPVVQLSTDRFPLLQDWIRYSKVSCGGSLNQVFRPYPTLSVRSGTTHRGRCRPFSARRWGTALPLLALPSTAFVSGLIVLGTKPYTSTKHTSGLQGFTQALGCTFSLSRRRVL